jgi:hypothetical protein
MKTKTRAKRSVPRVTPLGFAKFHRGQIADAIISAYSNTGRYTMLPRPPWFPEDMIMANTPHCLGDMSMLTDLPGAAKEQGTTRFVWSPRPDFEKLFERYVPGFVMPRNRLWFTDGQYFIYEFNCGNGHVLQKWRRAMHLRVDAKPRPGWRHEGPKFRDRVIVHFEPGAGHVKRQKDEFKFHPEPRQLNDNNLVVLEQFVKKHPHLEFVEVGHVSRNIRGVRHIPTKTVNELIELIGTGSWFIGVLSGPLHIATGLGLKVINLINFPFAKNVVLPVLRASGMVEEEWLYPQHVHLHMDFGSPLVPKLSVESLEAAFGGDVYPFWDDAWLDLIFDEKYAN